MPKGHLVRLPSHQFVSLSWSVILILQSQPLTPFLFFFLFVPLSCSRHFLLGGPIHGSSPLGPIFFASCLRRLVGHQLQVSRRLSPVACHLSLTHSLWSLTLAHFDIRWFHLGSAPSVFGSGSSGSNPDSDSDSDSGNGLDWPGSLPRPHAISLSRLAPSTIPFRPSSLDLSKLCIPPQIGSTGLGLSSTAQQICISIPYCRDQFASCAPADYQNKSAQSPRPPFRPLHNRYFGSYLLDSVPCLAFLSVVDRPAKLEPFFLSARIIDCVRRASKLERSCNPPQRYLHRTPGQLYLAIAFIYLIALIAHPYV